MSEDDDKRRNQPPTIETCRRLAEEYDQDVIVLVSWHMPTNESVVTTYGASAGCKDAAARAGQMVAGTLGLDRLGLKTIADFRDPSEAAVNKAIADAARAFVKSQHGERGYLFDLDEYDALAALTNPPTGGK